MESINKEKIQELKDKNETFIVQFSASWCGPCRALTPILENVCDYSNVPVFKFDIGEDPAYSKELGITSIPFVQFFKEGAVVSSKVGMAPRDFYEEQVGIIKG